MALLRTAMRVYQYLFHPGVVLPAALVLLVVRKWATDRGAAGLTSLRELSVRVGALVGVELVAAIPVALYLLARRPSVTRLTAGTDWRINLVTALSLLLGGVLLWTVWSAKSWGATVSDAGLAIVATTVPYSLLAPVWNVSGHVTFTFVPTVLLALADDRFWPALAIPLVMVVNRPVLGAHTWLQSLGGLVVGAVGVGIATRNRSSRGGRGR